MSTLEKNQQQIISFRILLNEPKLNHTILKLTIDDTGQSAILK